MHAGEGGLGGGGMPPGLLPNHKTSIVMFLDRVYGIEEQSIFYRLIDEAFLPDLRAATTLDMVRLQLNQLTWRLLELEMSL